MIYGLRSFPIWDFPICISSLRLLKNNVSHLIEMPLLDIPRANLEYNDVLVDIISQQALVLGVKNLCKQWSVATPDRDTSFYQPVYEGFAVLLPVPKNSRPEIVDMLAPSVFNEWSNPGNTLDDIVHLQSDLTAP